MAASRASSLGWVAGVFLGRQHGWASGETTCTSVDLSGLGYLDGTYSEPYPEASYYYATREAGIAVYEIEYRADPDDFWWVQHLSILSDYNKTVQYRTSDTAGHPVDITSEWVQCSENECEDEALGPQPVFTCADETSVPSSTCTSVDVSGVGELDGTYTWEYAGIVSASSPNPDHLYVRVEGTETFEIKGSGRLWWMANADDATLRYQTYDDVDHPADITQDWAECEQYDCPEAAAVSQPVITCTGGTAVESTPSPTPRTSEGGSASQSLTPSPTTPVGESESDTMESTPSPTPGTSEGGSASQSSTPSPPTAAGESENDGEATGTDVGGAGGGGRFLLTATVGTIAGILLGL